MYIIFKRGVTLKNHSHVFLFTWLPLLYNSSLNRYSGTDKLDNSKRLNYGIKINNDISVLPDTNIVLIAIPVGLRDDYIQQFSKNSNKISLYLTILIILFFSYGHVYMALGSIETDENNIIKHR